MQKLDALGALDSTLIYVTSDMGNPSLHSTRNVPTVLAGGADGKFRMGRRLKMAAGLSARTIWCDAERRRVQRPAPTTTCWSRSRRRSALHVDTFGTQVDPKNTTGALSGLI